MLTAVLNWLQQNSVDAIQSIGIIVSLVFTARQIMIANKFNRLSAAMTITQSHKELWSQTISAPELKRFDDEHADLEAKPITNEERTFGMMLIAHMNLVYMANREGLFDLPKGFKQDMREVLLLPIPHQVWQEVREYQERGFAKYIDDLLIDKQPPLFELLDRIKNLNVLQEHKPQTPDNERNQEH